MLTATHINYFHTSRPAGRSATASFGCLTTAFNEALLKNLNFKQ